MNISEQRIGNLAQDQDGNLIVVSELTKKKIKYEPFKKGVKLDQSKIKAEPVTLDQAWLVSMGFMVAEMENAAVGPDMFWVKDGLAFFQQDGAFMLRVGELVAGKIQTLRFDKVHELQNIYAFMGAELTLKEPKNINQNVLKNLN